MSIITVKMMTYHVKRSEYVVPTRFSFEIEIVKDNQLINEELL